MSDINSDRRIVLTLDAGGTNLRFSAIRGGKALGAGVSMPSNGDQLDRCLANIAGGFERVAAQCPEPPAAISFAFPGPADFPNGIIGDLTNLPGFRGGVALGPMLEHRFGVPVYINNDGDLFTYGEAIGGLLPYVNRMLEQAGTAKRFKNLFGITLGTGFGAGIVREGRLFLGDNSLGAEIWLLRNKLDPTTNAEEGASIRAVRRTYGELAGLDPGKVPEPKGIFDIGRGKSPGNRKAACEAFRRLGEIVGDAMAQALTLVDGLAVIGGGISGAAPLFLPALVAELNSTYNAPDGSAIARLTARAFNLENPSQRKTFLQGASRRITVPGTRRRVDYDPMQRIGVGMSRLGTSEAVAIGAYSFALQQLDQL